MFFLYTHPLQRCPIATLSLLIWWLDSQKSSADRENFCIPSGHRSDYTENLNLKVVLGTVLSRLQQVNSHLMGNG